MALRDLLLFATLLASIPVVLYRPWIGFLLWYWIALMSPHRLTWGFMYDFPVAVLVASVTLMGLILARDRRPVPASPEIFLICAMAAWFTLTTYLAWVPTAAWNYWEQFMKILLFTLLTPMLIHGRRRVEWLMIVVAVSIGFYGIKGGVFTLATGGQSHVLGPPRSFIAGNTNLGLALVMTLPLILVLARQATQGRLACLPDSLWLRLAGWGGYGAFWLTGLATLFTFSRGAMVGMATIAPWVFLKLRRKLALILIAVLAVGVIGVTVPDRLVQRVEALQGYQEDGSAMSRLQAWSVAWNIARENPLTGAGFRLSGMGDERWLSYDTTTLEGWWPQRARAAHSNYFQVLGEHGFAGLGLYLALLATVILCLFRLARQARKRPDTVWISEYAWALLVGAVGYAVAGAFLDMAYFTLFYAFVALTLILRREYRTALEDRTAPADAPAPAGRQSPQQPAKTVPAWPGSAAGERSEAP